MKKMIITCLVASVALGFTIPEGAQNVNRHFDKNGNEHVSYSLAGKKVAVASVKLHFKKASADLVSEDRLH